MVMTVSRLEDMSVDGELQLLIEDDGDVIVTIYPDDKHEQVSQSVQFCTRTGGGRSPRVLRALRKLAQAMAADNADPECGHRQGREAGEEIAISAQHYVYTVELSGAVIAIGTEPRELRKMLQAKLKPAAVVEIWRTFDNELRAGTTCRLYELPVQDLPEAEFWGIL